MFCISESRFPASDKGSEWCRNRGASMKFELSKTVSSAGSDTNAVSWGSDTPFERG
jgi:hypothetical protein